MANFQAVYYRASDGSEPVNEFIDRLSARRQVAVDNQIDRLNALHAQAFEHPLRDDNWRDQVVKHSLGWVCARSGSDLIGFVNVAWDGGIHAFILDPILTSATLSSKPTHPTSVRSLRAPAARGHEQSRSRGGDELIATCCCWCAHPAARMAPRRLR